jgi:hypothetical protein
MNKIILNQDGVTIESIKKIHLKTDGALDPIGINIKAAGSASLELKGIAGV